MNAFDAPQPKGRHHDHPVVLPEPNHDSSVSEGAVGAWHAKRNVLYELNEVHSDFRRVFFKHFCALIEEENDEAYVCRMADYVRWILSMSMFVRVERPRGSKRFVLGYVKCDWVFSFVLRFEQMRSRLNRVSPVVLTKVEHGENKALRLACVGETDYELAVTTHRKDNGDPPLIAALEANDEESAMALLDGGDDPNEVDGCGRNALHSAAIEGCRQPLFNRILAMIHHVNAGDNDGYTALMMAAIYNQLDVLISLLNHPEIDVNFQGRYNYTALHLAVLDNHPAIVAQLLSDPRIDSGLKDKEHNRPPLKDAIDMEHHECVKLLREHGAPQE